MLFNVCACGSAVAASSFCAGGAGFVTAMMATLAASNRTQAAKTLRGEVPVVDWLGVSIVTDTTIVQFVPQEKRNGFAIERRVGGNTHPDKPPRTTLQGEWGLALHAESKRGDDTRHVMIDFGYTPEVLLNNMDILKVDPARFDAMVLSHGHYDHFGGMVGFLNAHGKALKKKLPFYVGGEDCFCLRRNPGGNFGALDRQAIMDADLALMMAAEPAIVADHAFTTGRIGQTSFETPLRATDEIVGIFDGFGCYPERMPAEKNTGGYIPDDFEHELATIYNVKDKGLVVLTSCSHRGVINTVRQAIAASGVTKVHAVLGGFHIVPPLDDAYIRSTIEEFREIDPDYLIVGHCTGDRFYDLAREALGDKVIHSAVGTRFVFGAS
jgi:7,8-dihydropterin-6-yl-methyl-4-(beta-D-ribofuranosyl)aminobenzene 5'-phosphate synthase